MVVPLHVQRPLDIKGFIPGAGTLCSLLTVPFLALCSCQSYSSSCLPIRKDQFKNTTISCQPSLDTLDRSGPLVPMLSTAVFQRYGMLAASGTRQVNSCPVLLFWLCPRPAPLSPRSPWSSCPLPPERPVQASDAPSPNAKSRHQPLWLITLPRSPCVCLLM